MNKLNSVLPVDIKAIEQVGVAKWQEEYDWPVSDKEYFDFIDMVLAEYSELCVMPDGKLRNVFLADHAFVTFLIQVCHAIAVKSRVKDVLVLEERFSKNFYFPDWATFSVEYKDANKNTGWKNRVKFYIRKSVKNLVFNRHINLFARIKGMIGYAEAWSIGSESNQKKEYIYASSKFCSYKYIHDIIPNRPSVTENNHAEVIEQAVDKFLNNICDKGGDFTQNLDLSEISRSWCMRVQALLCRYEGLLNIKKLPTILHVSDVTNTYHKLIALAFMQRGVLVNGYNHGNNMMLVMHKLISFTEISHCTNYICSTRKSAEYFEKAYRATKLNNVRQVNFVSTETNCYETLKESFNTDVERKQKKHVLLVGYPLSPIRIPFGAGLFFYFRLDLEIQLAKYLKSSGYSVTYKIHPDTDERVIKIMLQYVDQVDTGNFEQSIQNTDVLLFTYTETTTFSHSLCSNKQIIVIDLDGEMWNEESFKWIQSRCNFIHGHFDERNRIIFDKKKLKGSLSSASSFTYEYVKKVMIPQAIQV